MALLMDDVQHVGIAICVVDVRLFLDAELLDGGAVAQTKFRAVKIRVVSRK